MNTMNLSWVELAIVFPIIGTLVVRVVRDPFRAWQVALTVTVSALICTGFAWLEVLNDRDLSQAGFIRNILGYPLFILDTLSGPLLPLVALLHLLTILTTARVKMNRMSFTGHLAGMALRLGAFACLDPWPLIILSSLGVVPPFFEMRSRGKNTRVYVLHMVLFVLLFSGGWLLVEAGMSWAPAILVLAVLLRSGTVPLHLWVADLFENATFGTALLFITPITGVYLAFRLVLPIAPDWALQSIGIASLITSVYAAGLALVQTEARRFFANLFLSHASLVFVGFELHTTTSLTGALCLWISVALSLGGLGIILRTLEARHGKLSLHRYRGLYEQSPFLAVGFLLMGLASVGFPGTLGFVASELLIDGAIEANLYVGIGLVLAAALNGIAIVRVYLLLFTGVRALPGIPLGMTFRERITVLTLCAFVLGGGLIPQIGVVDRHRAAEKLMMSRK